MRARWLGLIVVVCLFTGESAEAQKRTIPEFPKFVFAKTPEVTVQLVNAFNGKPIRGKLISLTAVEAVIDTGNLPKRDRARGELGQRVSVKRMESFQSTDGRFEFTPDEDFQVVSERILAAYGKNVEIEGETDLDLDPDLPKPLPGAAPPKPLPGATPMRNKKDSEDVEERHSPRPARKPPGLGNGGFGGMKNLTKPKQPEPESTTPSTDDAESESTSKVIESLPGSALSEISEAFFCSECSKEIPQASIKSGVCPFCQASFVNTSVTPSSAPKNPFGKTGGAGNSGAGAFAATGPAPVAGQAAVSPSGSVAPTSGTVVVQGGEFSFDQIPGWAKGGLFILFVLVGYHLLFNR